MSSDSHVGQRACYVALRRKGWQVTAGVTSVWATHPEREVRLYASDFRDLLNKVSKQEAEWNHSQPRNAK